MYYFDNEIDNQWVFNLKKKLDDLALMQAKINRCKGNNALG